MKSLLLQPSGISSLSVQGNEESRIGDTVRRNARIDSELGRIESKIRDFAPLPVQVDVVSPEPPYFEYFTYCDVLGGIQLQPGSAEIAARIALHNQSTATYDQVTKFNLDWAFDKYTLKINSELEALHPQPIAFLPGSNMLHAIDQSALARVSDHDWLVKPHPITSEPTLRDLAKHFGYRRVLDPLVSGHSLIRKATHVATTQSSEFFILAGLLRLPIMDLSKYEFAWTMAYQAFGVVRSQDLEENHRRMTVALMHPDSGWLHPSMSDQELDTRINRYFSIAMQMRAPFKMVSTQRLIGKVNNLRHWDTPAVSKQGPYSPME